VNRGALGRSSFEAASRRVAVVGPVLPWRGGIAEHTTMLCRALQAETEVLIVSFRRQFPGWLHPGGRERRALVPPFEGAQFTVDTLNPLTWLRAARLVAAFHPEVVLIPWWTAYLGPSLGFIAGFCRRRDMHVRFVCHNIADHETARWKSALARLAWRQGHSFLVHSATDEALLRARLPDAVTLRHALPCFDQYPDPRRSLPRRARLELLFFGFVRPYKGLDVLLDAMRLLKEESVHLTVAGELWSRPEAVARRLHALGIEGRVDLVPRYLSDAEVAEVFARADAVVLPYRSGSNSGVVPLAYRYGKPVVVTRVGGLAEAVVDGETGFVVPPDSADALARTIARLTPERAAAMAPAIERHRSLTTWESLARCAASLP
jgi:glycosyltransferase involved in cell wall biosynthesis